MMIGFKFVKNFKVFGIISILLMAVGIAGIVLLPFGVNLFNMNIDFLGGTVLEYDMHRTMDKPALDEVGVLVRDIIGTDPTILKSGETGVTIKTQDIDTNVRQSITDALKAKYGISDADLLTADNVTASVGEDLRNAAILSIIIASALMLLYITIRFEFTSGLAAVLAILHDIFVTFSVYIILQIPLDMNFIAAVLTILGYSITSCVIIFDRVRENRKYMPKSDFRDIIDASAGQTFTRNINTTLTTLLPLVMIIILGVTSVRNFAIPLTIGIVAGAYSSIFLAGPMWAFLRGGRKERI